MNDHPPVEATDFFTAYDAALPKDKKNDNRTEYFRAHKENILRAIQEYCHSLIPEKETEELSHSAKPSQEDEGLRAEHKEEKPLLQNVEALEEPGKDTPLIQNAMMLLAYDPTPSHENPAKKRALQALTIISENLDDFPTCSPNFFVYLDNALSGSSKFDSDDESKALTDRIKRAKQETLSVFFQYCLEFNRFRLSSMQIMSDFCKDSTIAETVSLPAYARNNPIPPGYNLDQVQTALTLLGLCFYIVRSTGDAYEYKKHREALLQAQRRFRIYDSVYWFPMIIASGILANPNWFQIEMATAETNMISASITAAGYWIDVFVGYIQNEAMLSRFLNVKQALEIQIDEEVKTLKTNPICAEEFKLNASDDAAELKSAASRPTADQIATAIARHQKEQPHDEKTLGQLHSLHRKTRMLEKLTMDVQKKKEFNSYMVCFLSLLAVGKTSSATTTILAFLSIASCVIPPLAIAALMITASARVGRYMLELQSNIDGLEKKSAELEQQITQLAHQKEEKEKKGEDSKQLVGDSKSPLDTIAVLRKEQQLLRKNINHYRKQTRLRITETVAAETVLTTVSAAIIVATSSGIIASASAGAFSSASMFFSATGGATFLSGFGKAAFCTLTLGLGATPVGWGILTTLAIIGLLAAGTYMYRRYQNKKMEEALNARNISSTQPKPLPPTLLSPISPPTAPSVGSLLSPDTGGRADEQEDQGLSGRAGEQEDPGLRRGSELAA